MTKDKTEQTLGIIKPDAVSSGYTDEILTLLRQNSFTIQTTQTLQLSRAKAETFYSVHRKKPFFDDLVTYMTSGNIVVFIASSDRAITKYREIIGATDPAQAQPGTIRKLFGKDKERNAVHGSDSPENAEREINFFFK